MKKIDKNKLVTNAVVALLCLFFVVGVVWGGISIMSMEGIMVPYVPAESLSVRPETPQEMIDYINASIDDAVALKPKLETSHRCSIDEDDVSADGTDAYKAAVNYVISGVETGIENAAEPLEVDFGEGFAVVNRLAVNPQDIVSAECSNTYYECGICGETTNEEVEECPECDSSLEMLIRQSDEYTIKIKLADGSASAAALTYPLSDAQRNQLIKTAGENFFDCSRLDITYTDVEVVAVINRLTDKLVRLDFNKNTAVSSTLGFVGYYSYLEPSDISFIAEQRYRQEFTWPGVELSSHELSMEQKKTEALKAELTCSDPLAATVRWSVSDDSIATVDDEGYVKSKKVDGKVTVTAEFDFQGVTYSDSCEVFVKTSVEGLDLSEKNISLKEGQQKQLTAEVSPKKATVKTATWYSEDESIATVDANGTVTAVSSGKVIIYALSDDGYYKASCEAEVTK